MNKRTFYHLKVLLSLVRLPGVRRRKRLSRPCKAMCEGLARGVLNLPINAALLVVLIVVPPFLTQWLNSLLTLSQESNMYLIKSSCCAFIVVDAGGI